MIIVANEIAAIDRIAFTIVNGAENHPIGVP